MPWMRVSIGVGAGAVVAGIAGMILWIHDGSHFFDLAVAVALAGFLTLIASLLTRVFGSSHGSQDDAFRRGRSMGYDAGFLEGHRAARPVVVPMLHVVGRSPHAPGDDQDSDHQQDHNIDQGRDRNIDQRRDHLEELEAPLPAAPMWRRDAGEGWDLRDRWDRGTDWLRIRRTPLLVGALALGVLVVLTASMLLPTSASTVTSGPLPVAPFHRDQPSPPGTPAVLGKTPLGQAPVAAVTGIPPVAAGAAPVPAGAGAVSVPAASRPNVTPGAAIAAPVTIYLPAVAVPVAAPQVVPVVAAPVVPLTAAQQTAADAKAAADLTAANAAAAAAETARVAAAAAEATRRQALADAYAVAHPAG